MPRVLASSLLSLLLVTTLVWGGCISCEQYFMWPGAKSCCAPNGHCKTKTSTKQTPGPECKQIAFDHHKYLGLHIDLSVSGEAYADAPIRAFEAFALTPDINPAGPSPPDLNVLHSTFLI